MTIKEKVEVSLDAMEYLDNLAHAALNQTQDLIDAIAIERQALVRIYREVDGHE